MKQLGILTAMVLAMFLQTVNAADSEYESESRAYCTEQAKLAGLDSAQAEADFIADCLASMGLTPGDESAPAGE